MSQTTVTSSVSTAVPEPLCPPVEIGSISEQSLSITASTEDTLSSDVARVDRGRELLFDVFNDRFPEQTTPGTASSSFIGYYDDVIPDTSNFTISWRSDLRQNNVTQLMYEHAKLIVGYIWTLDIVLQDLKLMSSSETEIIYYTNKTKDAFGNLLCSVHFILTQCDFDAALLDQLITTPPVDYIRPDSDWEVTYIRDFIVPEITSYISDATTDLSEISFSNSCSV
ncbi:uncharacterized protein [Asterias amurensis]|uniref:uncharacterized protein n=1 Tax=Asterias amurensis TaxID=7602 RepID=UPI003AB6D769